jgi:uncharacterized membrane protein YozB (DUF420 family)
LPCSDREKKVGCFPIWGNSLASDIDIVVQLVILGLLLYGYQRLKFRHKLRDHGIIFTVATILNTAAILFLMVPDFLLEHLETGSIDPSFAIILVHVVLGGIAEILALWIVIRWHWNRKALKKCKGRMVMNLTYFSWLVDLAIGFGLYLFA